MNAREIVPAPSRRTPERSAPAYNLFRRKREPDLYCAVPEDYAVPDFVTETEWEFSGTIDGVTGTMPGFRRVAARAGVRLNGYHLFQAMHARAKEKRG